MKPAKETSLGRLKDRFVRSRLFRDATWSLGLKVVSAGIGFLVSVVLARALGVEGYGTYGYALALVTLLSIPAQVGLPALLVRETAGGIASAEPGFVKGIWVWAGRATGFLSLLLTVGAAAVIYFTNDGNLDTRAWTLILAFLLVPLVSLGNLRGAALRGLHHVVAGQLPEFILRPGSLLLIAGGLVFTTGALSPPQAMGIHVVAAAAAFIAGAWQLLRHTPSEVRLALPQFRAKPWLKAAWPLALISGVATINSQADLLMIDAFLGAEEVGIYKVSVQFAFLAAFGLQAVNLASAPRFARLYVLNEMDRLQAMATASTRFAMVVNLSVSIVFALFGRQIISLTFGDAYAYAYLPLLALLVGQLANSATGSAGNLLNMTGHEGESARAIGIAAVVNIGLNALLIPRWGMAGAAIATSVAIGLQNIWLWFAARRRLGIDTTAVGRRRRSTP